MRKFLILGGTAEARTLAAGLGGIDGVTHISSLAGRTVNPVLPEGDTRIGGFGGSSGLARWIVDRRITTVIDATHPFAAHISATAREVSSITGIPLVRLVRPPWQSQHGDQWIDTSSVAHAAASVASMDAARPFLTIGRQGVHHFASNEAEFLVRSIDPPEGDVPPHMTLLLDRGPFSVESELSILTDNAIDMVVTKNSGGPMTYAKVEAARMLQIPIIMVNRRVHGDDPHTPTFRTAETLLAWIQSDQVAASGRIVSG